MDIKSMTVEALKALAYDQLIELQRIQKNIALIEQEILKKSQPVEPVTHIDGEKIEGQPVPIEELKKEEEKV